MEPGAAAKGPPLGPTEKSAERADYDGSKSSRRRRDEGLPLERVGRDADQGRRSR